MEALRAQAAKAAMECAVHDRRILYLATMKSIRHWRGPYGRRGGGFSTNKYIIHGSSGALWPHCIATLGRIHQRITREYHTTIGTVPQYPSTGEARTAGGALWPFPSQVLLEEHTRDTIGRGGDKRHEPTVPFNKNLKNNT